MTDDLPPEPVPPDDDRDFVAEYRRREKEQAEQSQWHRLSGAGVEFAVAVGLGAAAGYGLDKWLDTAPWLLVAGVFVGFAAGLFVLIKASGDAFK